VLEQTFLNKSTHNIELRDARYKDLAINYAVKFAEKYGAFVIKMNFQTLITKPFFKNEHVSTLQQTKS
jgi:hypothetical protein